jgi:hypothetical protein
MKAQLHDLIKSNKSEHKCYVTARILAEGRAVLRLRRTSPIELIWRDAKQWAANKNTTFKIKDVEQLCRPRFEEIWRNVCQRMERPEQLYYQQNGTLEGATERIIL